ncbi:DUF5082 domain-containing protein [Geobacillus sp. 44B]|nr:DUF5082 domain-containing protein [Geobacillus sp. 44B]
MSSLWESTEKELERWAYETMIDCLESYQGQVKEAIEEFHQGTHAFYRANEEYVPIGARIYATADDLLHEISREIARLRRKIEELQ